jgi:AhpD family alkylhydroperoxidase
MTMLDPEDFSPELRAAVGDDTLAHPESLASLRVMAVRPELATAVVQLRATLARSALLPPRLLELVRLRVAFHNQCRSCMAMRSAEAIDDGMSEDVVCELAAPENAESLTDRERAALRYADLLATAHLEIGDTMFDLLRQHFTEGEIVELSVNIAIFVGLGRVAMSWDLVDDLPAVYRQPGVVGPWDGSGVIRAH